MIRTKVKCELCGKEISKSNITKHLKSHKTHPEYHMPTKGKYKLNHDGLICQFCGKECKNSRSLCNHERLCKNNPNRQLTKYEKYGIIEGFNNKGRKAWNEGLTKETDDRVLKGIESFNENEKLGLHHSHSYKWSDEQKLLQSIKMKEIYANKDPETHICGRSKKGWYKGYYCQSSWELAFVIYCLDNNINFIRNSKGFKYIYENEEHTYYPDFYLLDNDIYIEVKGYYDKKSKAKAEQFQYNLEVLQYKQMKPILNYVEDKYGRNFTSLYEK